MSETPEFGELKRRCSILAKTKLVKNEHLIKILRTPTLDAFKCLSWSSFSYTHFLARVKCLSLCLTKLGVPIPLKLSLNILSCQKWGETPYQNTSFWGFLDSSIRLEHSRQILWVFGRIGTHIQLANSDINMWGTGTIGSGFRV